MKSVVLAIAFVSAAAAAAAAPGPTWFTVVGEPANPALDTVEVDATSAVAFESMRLVRLRVNRAQARIGFDRQPYHSYYSNAVVDCAGQKAWHRTLTLFDAPLWRGKMRVLDFKDSDARSLAFADMEANPRDRLIKAACAVALQPK